MEKKETVKKLAEHNLYVSFAEIRQIKESISRGTLWELVEERAQSHPTMFEALMRMYAHREFLEEFEKISKKRFMVSAHVNLERPEVARYGRRLRDRYWALNKETVVVLPDGSKPYHIAYSETIEKIRKVIHARIAIDSPFGLIPLELDEMYPFAQSLYPQQCLERTDGSPTDGSVGITCRKPEVSEGAVEFPIQRNKVGISRELDPVDGSLAGSDRGTPYRPFGSGDTVVHDRHPKIQGDGGNVTDGPSWGKRGKFIRYKGDETLRELQEKIERNGDQGNVKNLDPDRSRVIATLDMQFGQGVGTRLISELENNIYYKKSRKTGRVRNVFFDKTHVFSFNAKSGRITLTREGARLIHGHLSYPAYRVVIHDEAVPFAREGKSVFSRFVLHCDPDIRPGDQVLVVNEEDELVAFGRALLNGREMNDFNTGPAVNVRKGYRPEDAI